MVNQLFFLAFAVYLITLIKGKKPTYIAKSDGHMIEAVFNTKTGWTMAEPSIILKFKKGDKLGKLVGRDGDLLILKQNQKNFIAYE